MQKEAYPYIEYELFLMINALRDVDKAVSRKMIQRRGRALLRYHDPTAQFKFSNGWFQGFLRRWHFSWRCKTKNAQIKPEELQGFVNNWLCFFRRVCIRTELLPLVEDMPGASGLLRISATLPRELQGPVHRFELHLIMNMDETPLPFELTSTHTYAPTGLNTISIKQIRSGWGKRQATAVIWISADGQIVSIMLIFHGEGTVKSKEQHLYEPGIRVEFNDKAYNNTDLMLKQLNEDIAPRLDGQSALIVLDCVAFHKTEPVKQKIQAELASTMGMVPPGCTPCCQPLDVSFNYPYKSHIADFIDEYEEQIDPSFTHIWTTSERRVLLTKAVGYAKRQMETEHGRDIIKRSFKATGISISPMGDENDQISIKDAPHWSFDNWRERGRQHEGILVKQKATDDEEFADLDTRIMSDSELRIYFSNYSVKRLTVLCKMRGLKGYSVAYRSYKKAGLIRLLVEDFQRMRESSGASRDRAIDVNAFEDSDTELLDDDDDNSEINSNIDANDEAQ